MSADTPPLHVAAKSLPPTYFHPHGPKPPGSVCLNVVAFYRGLRFPFSRSGYGQPWVAPSHS